MTKDDLLSGDDDDDDLGLRATSAYNGQVNLSQDRDACLSSMALCTPSASCHPDKEPLLQQWRARLEGYQGLREEQELTLLWQEWLYL